MTQREETLAYKAGRAFARIKPMSPAAFAIGGVAGYCALTLLGTASAMLANAMLLLLIVALGYELLCRSK